MLDVDSALNTLAQLGVAIPSFAAVVNVLRHKETPLNPAERISFILMSTLASVLVIGSLFPFVIMPMVGERETWRIGTVILGVTLMIFAVNTGRIAWQARGTPAAPRRPRLLWWTGLIPFM